MDAATVGLTEQWKYERAYDLENYRMGPVRFNYASRDISDIKPGQVYLDVGCGRGEMMDIAEQCGAKAFGIETVPQLCDGVRVLHGDICNLPFKDSCFDYVSCYDVLEHLVPGEEQQALDELGRVCKGLLFLSTNDRPSHLPDGTDLHVNKRPQKDWNDDIVRRWENVTFELAGRTGDWHWKIDFR